MKKSVLITNSGINQNTGGGIVSYNLLKALQQCTDVQFAFASQKFPENKFEGTTVYSINPGDYNYNADPFSMDYLAYHILPTEPVDIVQTYGCPFGLTVEELKRNKAKVVADVAPHNLELSREEHLHHCGQYPYPHLTEDMLWGMYSRNLRDSDIVIVHSKVSASYIEIKARLKEKPTVIPHGCYIPGTIPEYPEKFIPGYFGACLTGDVFVFLEDGNIKTIKELEVGDRIWGCDIQKNEHVIEKVKNKIHQGVKKTYKIKLGNRIISATEDHLFMLLCNKRSANTHYYHWTPLRDLQKGDTIITLRELDKIERKRAHLFGKEITCNMMKVIGCYMGDGYHRRNCEFKLYLPEKDKFREKYKRILEEEFKVDAKLRKDCIEIYSKKLVKSFINAGLYGNFKTKRIPDWIFRLKRCHIESFIEGLLDADGHYEKNKKTCKISLANEYLMKQVHMLAMQIGLKTENVRKTTIEDNRFNPPRKRIQWVTRIWILSKKRDNREKEERLTFNRNLVDIQNIVEVKYVGEKEVYDITLDNSHTFYANGILTHNCGYDKGFYYLSQAWMAIASRDGSQIYLGGHDWKFIDMEGGLFHLGGFSMPMDYKKYYNIIGEVQNPNDFYKQISIYIQPSVSEGFGITPLEAMANGRPVIVTDQTGVADLITDGKEGFIVPIKNKEAIGGRILYFKENPNEIKRMGAEARKTAEKYEWGKVREQYVSVYNQL